MNSIYQFLRVCVSLATTLAFAIAAQAQDLTITNPRMVYPDSVIELDFEQVFVQGHPGLFRADLAITAQEQDPDTGLYLLPKLDLLWSISDANGTFVGNQEWNGGSGALRPPTLLEWDATSGDALLEVSIPIGGEQGMAQFPYFASEYTTLHLALGALGELRAEEPGPPLGVLWAGDVSFEVNIPDRLALLEERTYAPGDSCVFQLIFNPPTIEPEVWTLESIGRAVLTPAVGVSGGPWEFEVPAGTANLLVTFWIQSDGGAFKIRARGPSGAMVESQIVDVLYDAEVLSDPGSLDYYDSSGMVTVDSTSDYPEPVDDQMCREAKAAEPRGDVLSNCTRPFIELVEAPQNPDCGNSIQNLIYPTKCLPKKDAVCEFAGTVVVHAPKYLYTETVDRDVGEVEVSYGYSTGSAVRIYFVGEASAGMHIEGTVMSSISRRCCKYEHQPGETAFVTEPGCKQ